MTIIVRYSCFPHIKCFAQKLVDKLVVMMFVNRNNRDTISHRNENLNLLVRIKFLNLNKNEKLTGSKKVLLVLGQRTVAQHEDCYQLCRFPEKDTVFFLACCTHGYKTCM